MDEVVQLEESEEEQSSLRQLRAEREQVDLLIRQVQLRQLTMLQDDASDADLAALEDEHSALEAQQRALSDELSSALLSSHLAFHAQWGQLFKAGHQNSRWAQQVQDYACLYTSHATNLLYATGNTTFRALTDLMPHDRAVGTPMTTDEH